MGFGVGHVLAPGSRESFAWNAPPADPAIKTWIHLDFTQPETRAWLDERTSIDEAAREALITENTRPRCLEFDSGVLINLRGVNLNPGAEPDDMISLRIWVEAGEVITMSQRRLLAVEDVQRAMQRGQGPEDPGTLIAEIARRLHRRLEPVIDGLDESLEALEDRTTPDPDVGLHRSLGDLRRSVIGLRRYLAPQREALSRASRLTSEWLSDAAREQLRESTDAFTRAVEILDELRDRASITREQISSELSAEQNRRLYALSLITALFLPLGFVTGLLGINVGGMPGAEDSLGFPIVVGILGALFFIELVILRRAKWF